MPLVPHDWNVVVLGRWNRAILTPQGVAQRLFNIPLEAHVPLLVEFPLDALGPFRITHEGLVVMVTSQQLIVETQTKDLPSLRRAMEIAIRAMRQLPETPVTAAGYNIRYRSETPETVPPQLCEVLQHPWQACFAHAGYPVLERGLNWIGRLGEGKVGVNVTRGEVDFRIGLNFERAGGRDDLLAWLDRPTEEIEGQLHLILSRILHIGPEDIS